jgi:hypothetical protein
MEFTGRNRQARSVSWCSAESILLACWEGPGYRLCGGRETRRQHGNVRDTLFGTGDGLEVNFWRGVGRSRRLIEKQ